MYIQYNNDVNRYTNNNVKKETKHVKCVDLQRK